MAREAGMEKKKGQSILEYVIVLTAIVAAVAAAAVFFVGKDKTKGMGKLMNQTAETIGIATGKVEAIGQ